MASDHLFFLPFSWKIPCMWSLLKFYHWLCVYRSLSLGPSRVIFRGEATVLFYMLSLSLRALFWGVSCFPGFLSNPCFLRQYSWFLRQHTVLPSFLRAAPREVHSWGAGGPCVARRCLSLVHDFTWACSLTCQPDSRFPIPARFPFPQGIVEPISVDSP